MKLTAKILGFFFLVPGLFAQSVASTPATTGTTATVAVTTTIDPHTYLYFTSNVLGEIDPCG